MALKISTGLPNCREGRLAPIGSVTIEAMLQVARQADALGFYSLWPNELFSIRADVASGATASPQLFDVMITLAYVAAETSRIRLVPSTLVLPHHEPIVLSREVATLDFFSGGRVTLGVGLGGDPDEFRRLHRLIQKPHRGNLMDEYLRALRVLWTAEKATFEGRYTSFEDVDLFPKPAQTPLPVFVAGPSEGALRRVATFAQGWIVSRILPDEIRQSLDQLRGFAAEAGRHDVDFEVARQFYVSLAPTMAEAEANYRAAVPQAAGAPGGRARPRAEEQRLIGTPAYVRERLAAYSAAGVTEAALIFYYADVPAAERQLELCAREVMPAFA